MPWCWEGWSTTPACSGSCSHPTSASQHLHGAAFAPNCSLIGFNYALVRPGWEQQAEPVSEMAAKCPDYKPQLGASAGFIIIWQLFPFSGEGELN